MDRLQTADAKLTSKNVTEENSPTSRDHYYCLWHAGSSQSLLAYNLLCDMKLNLKEEEGLFLKLADRQTFKHASFVFSALPCVITATTVLP